MGENAITYGSIGVGLLIFAAVFGIFWSVIDARNKSKSAEAKQYADDKQAAQATLDKVERVLEKKIKDAHDRIELKDAEIKELNYKLGGAEKTAEIAKDIALKLVGD